MRLCFLCFIVWSASLSVLSAGSSKPEFTLRFYLQAASKTGNNWVPYQIPDPPETIIVEKYGFLSEKYIVQATPLPDGTTMLQFDAIGSNILDTTTSSSPGKIMVIVCNNRAVFAPVIDKPMRQGRMIVPGLTPEEVAQLRAYIAKHLKG